MMRGGIAAGADGQCQRIGRVCARFPLISGADSGCGVSDANSRDCDRGEGRPQLVPTVDIVRSPAPPCRGTANRFTLMSDQAATSDEMIWRRYGAMEERLSAPLSERMLDLAGLRPGMRVLDLATGRGEPAVRAAKRVAPNGMVLGTDVAAPMLAMARERAEREGASNLELRLTSAETLDGVPQEHFDVVLSRWGLMYFDAPVAALAAARRSLVRGGALVAALWAEPETVSFAALPRRALARLVSLPADSPDVPGVFRFADPSVIARDFALGGFGIVHIETIDVDVMEAATADELVAWARAFGLERLLRDLPAESQEAWRGLFVADAEPLRREGMYRLGGRCRIVVALPMG